MSETQVLTEGTNLAVVLENRLGSKTLPTSGWYNLEPDSYGEFGSSMKKDPRNPISKQQMPQKPMLVDEDSGISIEADITKSLIDRFANGIYRAKPKHSGGTGQSVWQVQAVDGTGITVSGSGALQEHTLVYVRGMGDDNDALWEVTSGSTGTKIHVTGMTTNVSPPANATVEVAGFRFTASDASLDANGNFVCAAADFTSMGLNQWQWGYLGGAADDNRFDTAEFFGAVRIALPPAAHLLTLDRRTWVVEQKAYLDLGSLATQLDSVVQAQTAGIAGNSITVASVADGTPAAKAEKNLGSVTTHIDTVIRAKLGGTAGNAITVEIVAGAPTAAGTITEVGTHVKIAIKTTATATTVADFEALLAGSTLIEVKTAGTGATSLTGADVAGSFALAGGTAATAPSVAEVGSAVTLHYTPGATTVAQLEAVIDSTATLIEIKTPGTGSAILLTGDDDFTATALAHGAEGTDAGTAKRIDFYFTRWWRNVPIGHDDYDLPSWAFEVTYPGLYDGQPGFEYLLGNMINDWTWNFPLTGKATASISFVGTKTLRVTDTRKTGPADALDPNATAGVSTSTDLQRLRLSDVDETGISTDFTSLKIMNSNNASPQKQLADLGAHFINTGQHNTKVDSELIFTSAEVINKVRTNDDCTLDVLMRNEDFGALIDVHAMTLDSAGRKMERNKSVMISSKATAHRNAFTKGVDSLSMFAYLPPDPEDADE